jgi:hypothetical protein
LIDLDDHLRTRGTPHHAEPPSPPDDDPSVSGANRQTPQPR